MPSVLSPFVKKRAIASVQPCICSAMKRMDCWVRRVPKPGSPVLLEALPTMATTDGTLKNVSSEARPAARKRPVKGADVRLKQAQSASILLKHVSDPTRLQVVVLLTGGEQHVGSLCEKLGQTQPAVSHHLALLRHG